MIEKTNFEKILEIAFKRGFFWPTAEFYPDKQAGFYDYGPLGVKLKNKIIEVLRKCLEKEEYVEIDGAQILPESVFLASGHLKHFTDPLAKCRKCGFTARADSLTEDYKETSSQQKIKCPKCGSNLEIEEWNMMMKTAVGTDSKICYFRPETCQSIFSSFPRLFRVCRSKLPLPVLQVGKVFRNEISPRQALIRLREITQAEIEVFFNPEKEEIFSIEKEELPLYINGKLIKINAEDAVKKKLVSKVAAHYLSFIKKFYLAVGIPEEKIRFRQVSPEERPFYARETWDLECSTSLGWIELCACNHRTDYDLKGHEKVSKHNFHVVDETTGKKIIPNVFELSLGIDRLILAILDVSYKEEKERTLFKFKPYIAPISIAIFPLVKRKEMEEIAKKIYERLKEEFSCFYDDSGSIGRRYRRQDEIGTPFCITVDEKTIQDGTVTVRDRDSMKQERVSIENLKEYFVSKINF